MNCISTTIADLGFNLAECSKQESLNLAFGFGLLTGVFGPKEKIGNRHQYHTST